MNFNKKQIMQLKAQGKQIEKYINEVIMPCIKEPIEVSFGKMVERGRYGERKEREYTLYVDMEKAYASCGGLTLYFDIGFAESTFTDIDVYTDYSGIGFLYTICLEWPSVKMTLNSQIEAQKENLDKVFNNFAI